MKPNTKEILDLADYMAALPDKEYNQRHYVHACGTPACIAGHQAVRLGYTLVQDDLGHFVDAYKDGKSRSVSLVAASSLGLDETEMDCLFHSRPYGLGYNYNPTPSDAARTLRHLAETGKVNWNIEK